MKPSVSIIIPCYNAADCVANAVRSALEQTCPSVEVIVVDDGSTDDSRARIAEFSADIRFESQANRGGGAARNRGLSVAAGDYVLFLDADDLLYPEKVSRQVEASRSADTDMVIADYDIQYADRTKDSSSRFAPYSGGDPVPFILSRELQTSAPLHSRQRLLDVGGFREDLPCAQEFDLHLRLACSGVTMSHLREPLHLVRKRDASVSSSYPRVLNQFSRILPPALDSLVQAGTATDARRRAFAAAMARAARHYLQRGFTREGRDYFRIARGMHASGAWDVYRQPARTVAQFVGPVLAEHLSRLKRGSGPNEREAVAAS